MAAIYRYEIAVDDAWHAVELPDAILHVASRRAEVVEVWALDSDALVAVRHLRVFGTGHPLPDERLRHVGTALAPGGLVWHLMERY